jgi:CRISPR-associated protein Csx17
MPEVVLEGCTPEPLMSYLKALGVLRLVSEQADADARACWRNDVFVLSSSLNRDNLLEFFLDRYQPTPIVAPWAGGSGFFPKDNHDAVDALAARNVSARCQPYRAVIEQVRRILREERITHKPKDTDKDRLLRRYRREFPLPIVEWMDAAMVLQEAGQTYVPLLGTGGNDGRLDFSQNFMGRLVALGLHQTPPFQQTHC